MKRAKENHKRRMKGWLKHHPWLKRRIPSAFDLILGEMAKHNPQLRHFLTFDVTSLKGFNDPKDRSALHGTVPAHMLERGINHTP
jgi:hypothetical protein